MAETIGYAPPEIRRPPYSPFSPEAVPPIVIDYGDIPRPENRSFSEQARHTAGHELNHVFVALDYGIMPTSLSVIPEGNSLGRTMFAGEMSTEAFKVIAAGGGVDTAFGKASGAGSPSHPGSDLFHIDQLHRRYGGIDVHEAIARASRSVNSVPENVRQKASEIIATLGHVSGEEISNIIRIAEHEVQHGITVSPTIESAIETIKHDAQYQEALLSGKQTVIGIDENGTTQEPTVIGVEEKACARCGGKDIHAPLCVVKANEDQPERITPLPQSETIVDFSKRNEKEDILAA